MKIGMVLDRVFPPDIRVEKEARTLIKAGHEVYLLCMKSPKLPDDDVYEGIKLNRREFYQDSFISKITNRLVFKNFKLIRQIGRFVSENSIEILHVHDLPMVKSAVIATGGNIPVVADLHENYPAAVQLHIIRNSGIKTRLFNGIERWKRYEEYCLKQATHAIVVVDEAKKRVVNDYGISEEKITVISNTEDANYFTSFSLNQELIDSHKDYFNITYTGAFGSHRGLDVPVKAMPILREKIPNIRLIMVGKGDRETDRTELEELAENLGVSQNIEFTGWQPFDLIPSYISLSDICLVPHHSNPHTDSTIPHKIFQYMMMGKPVIVSSCKPLARIVNETQAGLVFESGNVDDFARACLELMDEDKRKRFGENGRKAVLNKYNWEKTGEDLTKAYDKIRNSR